jgi:hypothetical protein
MVAWSQLILPILISAVLVFIGSTVIHVVIKWHNPDYKKLPNEDEVRAAIRKGSPAPAQYIFPHCLEGKDKNSPEMQQKFRDGPVGVMFIRPSGDIKMGAFLGAWFLYTVVIGILAGYSAQMTVAPGADYMRVFRIVGTAAWLAYAWQAPADSIWKGVPWSSTVKTIIDGLVYALLTAGTFAWLWPR